jgi:hypothetical protein
MKFQLTIETGNVYFADQPSQAVAEALGTVAQKIRDGHTEAQVRDPNSGYPVGEWLLREEDNDERSPAEQSAAAYLRYANLPTQHEDHLCDEDVNDSYDLTGTAYMLEGGGPTVWFYMVKDNNGQEDFGVIEHSQHETTYAVLPAHQAEVIDLALRTPREG